MSLGETKTPDIPTVPEAKGALARFIQAVTETLQVREGRRGNQLDQAVTYRDLVSGGIVTMRGIGQVGGRAGGLAFTPVAGGDEPDPTEPPLLTGLKVTPGLNQLFVQWDAPIYTQGHGPAGVEVWAAPYSGTGPLPTVGGATRLELVQGVLYPHPVQHGTTWHYWAYNVTVDGVRQAVPTGGTNGVSATAELDTEAALSDLTGKITESHLYDALGKRIDLIDGSATLPGSVAYRINAEADAREIAIQQEASARADETGKLFAQWAVKIDAAGRVSGIGLASEPAAAGGSTSAFGVRADRFFVAAPSDFAQEAQPTATAAGQTWFKPSTKATKRWDGAVWQPFDPVVPFAVQTTPLTESGKTIPPGVYMDAAYIRNVSALIARFGDASIGNALIADLSAEKLTAGDGTIGGTLKSVNYQAGSQGWRLHRDGSADITGTITAGAGKIGGNTITESAISSPNYIAGSQGWQARSDGNFYLNNMTARGAIMGGSYTEPNWPANGGGGFHLSGSGLFLGNPATGSWFFVQPNGDLWMPGMLVSGGTLTISQANVINTINLAGESVTVPRVFEATGNWIGQWNSNAQSVVTMMTAYVYMPNAGKALIFWKGIGGYTYQTDVFVIVYINGVEAGRTFSGSAMDDSPSVVGYGAVNQGNNTITVTLTSASGFGITTQKLVVMGAQR